MGFPGLQWVRGWQIEVEMPDFVQRWFDNGFMPHLYCLRGDPLVLWLHVISDGVIAAAYFAISVVLLSVIRRRKEPSFGPLAMMFVLFIAACGITHGFSIWTIWIPSYRLEGAMKALTGGLSLITAIVLYRMRPVLQSLPSISDLQREIDSQARHAKEMQAQEERHRLLLESIEDYAVFRLGVDGRVESWNKGAERMKGYSGSEILGKLHECFYIPEDRADGLPELALKTVRETGRYSAEGWQVCKDGTRFWAHVTIRPILAPDGELLGYAKVTRDKSESLVMETRYMSLLDSAPDAMVIVAPTGKIQLVNRMCERLFGYRADELIGSPVEMLIPESMRDDHVIYREGYTPRKREMGHGAELVALRKDGTVFPAEISLSPLRTPQGLTVTAAIRDVTERRAAVQQLAEKMEELRQSNESLQQFVHIASHDLQEPLRMVTSYTQLLAKRYKGRLDGDADDFIEFALDGTKRMKLLIQDLLDFSRAGVETMPKTEFEGSRAMRTALDNLQAAIEESGVKVSVGALPRVFSVEGQLAQIFQNLVGNAIKYRTSEDPWVRVTATEEEAGWTFSIADNGIGIDPKYFERIFVIFQRLHGREEYEGTGIGLAICQRIVQRQGGRIWVESANGEGATFQFTLPRG